MKKKTVFTLLIAISLVGCQKEKMVIASKETVAFDKITNKIFDTSVTVISSDVKSVAPVGLGQLYVFKTTPIAALVTPDKYDKTKSAVQLQLNGKVLNAVAYNVTVNGLISFRLESTTGLPYYSFQVMPSGQVINVVDANPIPFYVLSTPAYPIAPGFFACMSHYTEVCNTHTWCKVMFGTSTFGLLSAGIGWGFGCLIGIKP